MQIEVRATNIPLTDAIAGFTRNRITSALSRFAGAVRTVGVWFCDENGPKGGRDMTCRVRVDIGPGSALLIEERSSDLYAAIGAAVSRARSVVARRLIDRNRAARSRRRRTRGEAPRA